MRFVSIASGSSGNCIYTGTEESHILIDAGISAKRIEQGLNALWHLPTSADFPVPLFRSARTRE